MRITVPANVLLLGEYAVLEEGGVGVALAVEPRLSAKLTEAPRLELSGSWPGNRTVWTGGREPDLLGRSVESVAEHLGTTAAELRRLPLRVEVDSSAFYDPSGGKRGFGSSAATAIAVCFALLDPPDAGGGDRNSRPSFPDAVGGETAPGLHPAHPAPFENGDRPVRTASLLDSTYACALRAHRAFQGGRGSGYDVAASVYGGIGRFAGGAAPSYVKCTLPWLPPLALFRGGAPVQTKDAVARYVAWKADRPRRAMRFMERSNECVEGFLAAGSWTEAERWVEAARTLSIELGAEIGAPAVVHRPAGFDGLVKAVGAGNELGVAFGRLTAEATRSDGSASFVALKLAHRGVGRAAGGEGDRLDAAD